MTTEKNWPGDEVKHELFCSLKANSLKTGIKHLNDWFDSNKELHYPFLGTRIAFLMIFTTRVNSYIPRNSQIELKIELKTLT